MAAVISFDPAQAWLVASLAGTCSATLTNFANSSYPAIAQTSKGTEINGTFVETSSGALTITDTGISDGSAYIYMYISGGTTVLAETTNVAPTFDATKSGWYDATGDKRCIGAMTKSGASYTDKYLIRDRSTDLDNYVTGSNDLTVANDLTVGDDLTVENKVNIKYPGSAVTTINRSSTQTVNIAEKGYFSFDLLGNFNSAGNVIAVYLEESIDGANWGLVQASDGNISYNRVSAQALSNGSNLRLRWLEAGSGGTGTVKYKRLF